MLCFEGNREILRKSEDLFGCTHELVVSDVSAMLISIVLER